MIFLEKIMHSCPPVISNGGKLMKRNLAHFAKEVSERKIPLAEIEAKLDSLLPKTSKYNIYKELATQSENVELDFWAVANFFAGAPHIAQALEERGAQDIAKLSESIKDAYFFAHVLTPIRLTLRKRNTFEGVYENAGVKISIRHMRILPKDRKRFNEGSIVLMHYSCIIDEIDQSLAQKILFLQREHKDFFAICQRINGTDIEHKFMAYDPWCERITK